ncbi:MAG: hypothetical protein AVO35_09075 [Candidatus Aegiribacteria sp. MLS_C]|nr:MAG: hypothetical protein AVO35_09075 [Candidatus Aegiribacteria sp. MLS_C]
MNRTAELTVLSFLLSLPALPVLAGSGTGLLVPPGGYAWTVVDGNSDPYGFRIVPVIAPGPWPVLRAGLPEEALAAMDSCGSWLREDLYTRFADLLYHDLTVPLPAVPVPSDIDGDGMEDLLVMAPDGSLQKAILLPSLAETGTVDGQDVTRRLRDVTGDGLPDTVMVTPEGVIILYSGGRPAVSSSGWDLPPLSGTALMDVEGDGLHDLVMGTESGRILICRNRGTSEMPCFVPFSSSSRRAIPVNPGAFSAPAILVTDDSKVLLAVGTGWNGLLVRSGRTSEGLLPVQWSDTSNTMTQEGVLDISPVWTRRNGTDYLVCGTRSGELYGCLPDEAVLRLLDLPPVPGTYARLAIANADGDTIPDLVAGTGEGGVYFLRAADGWFEGEWTALQGIPSLPSCAPAPWDGGLVFGTGDGRLEHYSVNAEGEWQEYSSFSPFSGIDAGEFCVPSFADLDGDGVDEMITGSAGGDLTLFVLEGDASSEGPVFLESGSWYYSPGGSLQDLDACYSRYFSPTTVLRVPSGLDPVIEYSGQILSAPPLQRDEVAYCIAHTPTDVLLRMLENGDQDIFSLNARLLYEMAGRLPYADIVDSSGTGWCRLRTAEGWYDTDPVDYYRFVVHPRILFEVPARVDTGYWMSARDSSAMSMDEWLNHEPDDLYGSTDAHVFWREFIPSDTSRGGPLLESLSQAATYEEAVVRICDFQSHSQPRGIMSFGYATNDLQPMVIYAKAYGSCGEQSILQTALCRSFLVPAFVVGCRGEDHQWAHYLDPASGRWDHWDINYGLQGIGGIWVSGEGIDHGGKTISTITAFGPDDTVWPVTSSVIASPGSGYMPGDSGYTPTATVDIAVIDPSGRPVEGAMVLARSHWENANSVSVFDYTDLDGDCTFELGWEPLGGYTIDVVSPFGTTGSMNVAFREGFDYSLEYTVPCSAPVPQSVRVPQGQDVTVNAAARLYPVGYFSGSLYSTAGDADPETRRGWTEWKERIGEGCLFFMDGMSFRRYREGLNCRALARPFAPSPGDTCYAVLDNRNSMFTWLEYDPGTIAPLLATGTPVDAAFLEGSVADRMPLASCVPAAGGPPSSTPPARLYSLNGLAMCQDDPSDPLSAGVVLGPFRVPGGQRSSMVGVTGRSPGMDVDLFLFGDSDGDMQVDGMEELTASSTTPTAEEEVSFGEPDTARAYWVYAHGWKIPGDSGTVDLYMTFVPEMVPVSSLRPAGPVSSMPDLMTFDTEVDVPGDSILFLESGGDTVRALPAEGSWTVPAGIVTGPGRNGRIRLLDGSGADLGEFEWVLEPDWTPPELGAVSVSVDTSTMRARFEVPCTDAETGVRGVFLSVDSLAPFGMRASDSIWRAELDLMPHAGTLAEIAVTAEDSAGNGSSVELALEVPPRPAAVFSHSYPTGTVYDRTPVFQVLTDVVPEAGEWTAEASLADSSGSLMPAPAPLVADRGLLQFRTAGILEDGSYVFSVVLADSGGNVIGMYSWEFEVAAMSWSR